MPTEPGVLQLLDLELKANQFTRKLQWVRTKKTNSRRENTRRTITSHALENISGVKKEKGGTGNELASRRD